MLRAWVSATIHSIGSQPGLDAVPLAGEPLRPRRVLRRPERVPARPHVDVDRVVVAAAGPRRASPGTRPSPSRSVSPGWLGQSMLSTVVSHMPRSSRGALGGTPSQRRSPRGRDRSARSSPRPTARRWTRWSSARTRPDGADAGDHREDDADHDRQHRGAAGQAVTHVDQFARSRSPHCKRFRNFWTKRGGTGPPVPPSGGRWPVRPPDGQAELKDQAPLRDHGVRAVAGDVARGPGDAEFPARGVSVRAQLQAAGGPGLGALIRVAVVRAPNPAPASTERRLSVRCSAICPLSADIRFA